MHHPSHRLGRCQPVLAHAKKNPGRLNDGTAGNASAGPVGGPAVAVAAYQGRPAEAHRRGHGAAPARLPEVHTVAEMGFKDFETSQGFAILVPKGTPRDIVERLQEESLKALKSNSATERFVGDSAVGWGRPPQGFAACADPGDMTAR